MDYRSVNKKLIADKYPLPRIDDILDNLGRATLFSVLDLYNGFHQVPLEENSRDLTAFSTEQGSFRWKVLPFGLNVSPNSFSSNPKILAYPDYSMQFVLTVDASKNGVGAVLSQNDRPIAFASKAFSKAEQNKSTIEQDLIAIHWAIKHFRHYLYGTHFIVQSDHKPLKQADRVTH